MATGNDNEFDDIDDQEKTMRYGMTRIRPRMTVICKVHHQLPNEQPVSFESKFESWLESDDDPQMRRYKATEEWCQLPLESFIDKPAMVSIENREGMRTAIKPTADEQAEIGKKVIEIGFCHPGASSPTHDNRLLIPPGQSIRIILESRDGVLIRSRSGEAKYFMFAVPG